MSRMLRGFVADESGQDIIEYALLTSLLAIVSIAGLKILGTTVAKWYSPVTAALPT